MTTNIIAELKYWLLLRVFCCLALPYLYITFSIYPTRKLRVVTSAVHHVMNLFSGRPGRTHTQHNRLKIVFTELSVTETTKALQGSGGFFSVRHWVFIPLPKTTGSSSFFFFFCRRHNRSGRASWKTVLNFVLKSWGGRRDVHLILRGPVGTQTMQVS